MCGRYTTNTEEELIELKNIIRDISIRISNEDKKCLNKEVTPASIAPILTKEKEIVIMKWGFTKWDNKGVIFNTRSEGVKTSNYYKPYLDNHCVILAKCYYEWEKKSNNKKSKYEFVADNNIMYMAGIYRIEDNGLTTYTILTKEADDEINFIHDRMPIILGQNEMEEWLNGTGLNINEIEKKQLYYKEVS